MALSRIWYTDANLAVSDFSTAALLAKSILWGIKALLKGEVSGTNGPEGAPPVGSRWTCAGSSDSVTGAMDGTDRWTAAFDASKLVRAAAASPHSWIVLTSPVALGPMHMLIDWSTVGDTTWTIRFSYNAFTGGSNTTAPTSLGSWVHTNDGITDFAVPFNDGTATAHRIHRVTDADGNFWFLTSKNTQGRFFTMVGMQVLTEVRPGDSFPKFSFYHYRPSDRGAGHMSGPNPQGFWNAANGLTSNNSNPIVVGGRTFDGLALAVGGPLTVAVGNYGTNQISPLGDTVQSWRPEVNGADSKWDFFPIWVYSQNSTKSGTRGRIPDVSAVVAAPAVGAGAPTAAAQERTVVGSVVLPFSVVPSL